MKTPEFKIGLVVGKFCPLHLGHEYLINTASQSCKELIVLSYNKPELSEYPRVRRETWLKKRFPRATCLVIDDEYLKREAVNCGISEVPPVPDNTEGEGVHRFFVAWVCQHFLQKEVEAVFTSEEYGDGFARALSEYFSRENVSETKVRHLCVDKERSNVPISGTALRRDLHNNSNFLSPEVYADFVERVCFLGGESTGKTTLAAHMARELDTSWVSEYGRELWETKNGNLRYDDMLEIAIAQVQKENNAAHQARRWLFCDTSALTTAFYSYEMFGKIDPDLTKLTLRYYHHIFLCAPDFEFSQDGTRRNDEFRQYQHKWYEETLSQANLPFVLLKGSLAERANMVKKLIM